MTSPVPEYEIRTHASIRDVGEAEYRSLVGEGTPPFLQFEWLDALETSRAVCVEAGWLPQFITLHRRDADGKSRVIAVAPAYVKGHSDGEFVFDHSWANFAEGKLGLQYYPKLILAVPFTPATARKLLVHPDEDAALAHRVLCQALPGLARELGVSSAHVLFPPEEEAELFGALGMARRFGVQFHWENRDYSTYDDFLACFSAKRRAALRRERRELERQGIEIRVHVGKDVDERVIDDAYRFYLSTVDKYVWGRRYLNRAFFERVAETMADRLHVVMAYEGGKAIGGAFNLLGQDALYGRYWGASEERPFLHFNVCFYAGIEDCIRRGLARFEPGAGGEHKHARGFLPTVTHSAHYLVDSRLDGVVREFLAREREGVLSYVESARSSSVLRESGADAG